jgi:hypothetical protein
MGLNDINDMTYWTSRKRGTTLPIILEYKSPCGDPHHMYESPCGDPHHMYIQYPIRWGFLELILRADVLAMEYLVSKSTPNQWGLFVAAASE